MYDPAEQDYIAKAFAGMLKSCTKDGANKRARGEKVAWYLDPTHEVALFSHLYKWKRGDTVDEDSGVHPLVHLAWRALAIAYQENAQKGDAV